MRYQEIISEAPIDDITHIGDWNRNSSFRHEQDRKLLTNPKALEKIKLKWSKTDQHYNMFFVNSPEANRFSEVGLVSDMWLEKNMPKTYAEFMPKYSEDAINIIFTNNKGDERVPMTAWIIAHRFGHALQSQRGTRTVYYFKEVHEMLYHYMSMMLENYNINIPSKGPKYYRFTDMVAGKYRLDTVVTKFFETIGTMKSARDKEIRNANEFLLELLAQYMLTGKITFNPLPKSFKVGTMYFTFRGDDEDYEHFNDTLIYEAPKTIEDYMDGMLNSVVGEIFVM